MKECNIVNLTDKDRENLINLLTENLPALRARLGLSQENVSNIIGVSRQTYSSIETMKRKMSWNTFLSLILFFNSNEETAIMLNGIGIVSASLNRFLRKNNRKRKSN